MDFIQTAFNTFWNGLLTIIGGLLPTVDVATLPFLSAFQTVMELGKQLGFIIPWDTIWIALFIMVGAEIAVLTMRMIMWILRMVRG